MALPAKPNPGQDWTVWGDALHENVGELIDHLSSALSQIAALQSEGIPQSTAVTVVPGNGQVVVNWTAANGATGYTVQVQPITGGGVTPVPATKTATQLRHTFTGLTNGIGYQVVVTIQPTGVQKSVPFTPTGAAAATNVTATAGDGQVLVAWTGSADASGYTVGRNGNDTGGSGPWETLDGPAERSRTFLNLTNGTPYTFSVKPEPGETAVTVQATPVASAAPPVVQPPAGAGTVWLSGACGDHTTNANGAFGTWRGEPVTFARGWADADIGAMRAMYFMYVFRNANWSGILDCAIGGPGRNGDSWASAATGAMDGIWREQLQKINAAWWPNLKGVSLSMAHELSGNWYPWSVNSGNLAQFKTAWRRFYNIVGEELKSKGRKVFVTLNYNFDTVSNVTVQQIDPGTAYYDWLGVDIYNMWWGGTRESGLNSQAAWDSNFRAYKGTSPKGPGAWFDYAASIGKPICVPEWGLNPQVTIESIPFITNMRNLFASKAPADPYNPGAGKLAGDAYFNTWAQCQLYPTTNVPNSAAAYRNLVWGKA